MVFPTFVRVRTILVVIQKRSIKLYISLFCRLPFPLGRSGRMKTQGQEVGYRVQSVDKIRGEQVLLSGARLS